MENQKNEMRGRWIVGVVEMISESIDQTSQAPCVDEIGVFIVKSR